MAASQGRPDTASILLSQGAEPNIKNGDGDTALKAATRRGHDEVAKLLRSRGAVQ